MAELAAVDPAESPEAAERYAARLEADLENAAGENSGKSVDPVQMQADLGDGSGI